MARVRINGTELRYVEQGSGVPVVLVHGAWMDLRSGSPSEQPLPSATALSRTTRATTARIRGPTTEKTTPWQSMPPIWAS